MIRVELGFGETKELAQDLKKMCLECIMMLTTMECFIAPRLNEINFVKGSSLIHGLQRGSKCKWDPFY